MLQLNNDITFRYVAPSNLELVIQGGKSEEIIGYDEVLSDVWKSVFFTFEPTLQGVVTIITHFGSETNATPVTISDAPFSNIINSITIGEDFDGFLQDIRIYIPKLQTMNSQVVIPTEATFLPQCLCPAGYSISLDETECTLGETPLTR